MYNCLFHCVWNAFQIRQFFAVGADGVLVAQLVEERVFERRIGVQTRRRNDEWAARHETSGGAYRVMGS
jgi:hypothetical protein